MSDSLDNPKPPMAWTTPCEMPGCEEPATTRSYIAGVKKVHLCDGCLPIATNVLSGAERVGRRILTDRFPDVAKTLGVKPPEKSS